MDDCIFCGIVSGNIPAYTIYEDDHYLAFMDIFPRTKGHALVIPKKHYRWVTDVPEFGTYCEIAKKVALAVQKTLGSTFVSFVTVGEEVQHAHIHILPQGPQQAKGITFTPVIAMEKSEIQQLAQNIQRTIITIDET